MRATTRSGVALAAALLILARAAVPSARSTQTGPGAGPAISLVLVLDTSESVARGRYEWFGSQYRQVPEALPRLIDAAKTVLSMLEPADEAGLMTFGNHVTLAVPPSGNTGAVRRALDAVRPPPERSPYPKSFVIDALVAGVVVAAGRPGRSLVVLLSDGGDNTSWASTDDVIEFAKHSGVSLAVISAPRTRDTRDSPAGIEAWPIDTLRYGGAAELKISDRRLVERLRERLRLVRFSGVSSR